MFFYGLYDILLPRKSQDIMAIYTQTVSEVLSSLKTKKTGLTQKKAKERQASQGRNTLPGSSKHTTRLHIFLNQWKSPLLLILLFAAAISGSLGEMIDMTVILLTVGINALVGYFQENKANQALEKLRQLISYEALVLRDGQAMSISSEDIVVGDILLLEAGDKIQADARILEQTELTVDESVLTGESVPIKKRVVTLKKEVGIGDRKNMVFRGTTVTNGRAKVVVSAIGKNTELGKIASLVQDTQEEHTPLQRQMVSLSKTIGVIVVAISIAIFVFGVLSGRERYHMLELFETSVAVAVAAIPEGLIISLTVILAVGMQHILSKKALVRRLVAAETLGSVSVICTDKTGTLTEGRMSITGLITSSENLDSDELQVIHVGKEDRHAESLLALRIGTLCNDAHVRNPSESIKEWEFVGDTTDIALAKAGLAAGIEKPHVQKLFPRIAELPFDSKRKYMATTYHTQGKDTIMYVKGAPEVVLERCTHVFVDGKEQKLTATRRKELLEQSSNFAKNGLRTLAIAYKPDAGTGKTIKDKDVDALVFVANMALSDPLRADVKSTIQVAEQAGIRVIMITGDHAKTAQSIAKKIGLPAEQKNILDGFDLAKLSDKELKKQVQYISVFARVNPEDKIRIVQALKSHGEVVAMAGDGVNDAPALKGADIGIALGSGTDVAKETADIILQDDRLETMVDAVEEGRGIYENIKKVILFLLSSSFTEVILISGSLIAGLPLAVLPAQILWINLIQDTFPALALAFDEPEKDTMQDPPRDVDASIFDAEMKTMIIILTLVTDFVLFGIFVYFFNSLQDIVLTRTIIFAALGVNALLFIYPIRSMRHMIWRINPFGNKFVTWTVLLGFFLLFLSIYAPPLQILLRTVPLELWHWGVILGFSALNIMLIEAIKWVFIARHNKHHPISNT